MVNGLSLKKDAVSKAMRFTGVVVESVFKTAYDTTKEDWVMTIYDRANDRFTFDRVTVIGPTSQGFINSNMKTRLEKWWKIGVDFNMPEEFEGQEAVFEPTTKEFNDIMYVKWNPTERIGSVSATELATFKQKLTDIRVRAQAGETSAAITSSPITATTYTKAELQTLILLYSGKTNEAAQTSATKSKELTTSLKNDVLTGRAANVLIASGELEMDEDGVFTAHQL